VLDSIPNINESRTGGAAQVAEQLPSKSEALSSNSSTAKKEQNLYSWRGGSGEERERAVGKVWSLADIRLGCGSQAQGPEFKPHYRPKNQPNKTLKLVVINEHEDMLSILANRTSLKCVDQILTILLFKAVFFF
jgi:hypothetical protein